MCQVTARWVIWQVDELLPSGYSDEQKLHWLAQAEGFCALELGREVPAALRDDTVLAVEMPYDSLYCRYVEAQIHYHNGELQRYNNAMAMFQAALDDYARHYNRTHLPLGARIRYF